MEYKGDKPIKQMWYGNKQILFDGGQKGREPWANTVAYYKMDWNANDSSWNGNNWTATNITWVDWKTGSWAARFTRSSTSKIVMWTSSTLKPTTALTFSMWIRIINYPASYCSIWWNTLAWKDRWYLFDSHTTGVNFRVGNWTRLMLSAPSSLIPTNVWNNLCWTRDWATVSFYINGGLVATGSKSSITYTSTGFSLWNYYNDNTSAIMFDWDIDEVIVENRAWTATEVQEYYNLTK